MKLLSKLLILSLCLAAGTAECAIFQRFASLSRSWMSRGVAATVASCWFIKPPVVKAETELESRYRDIFERYCKPEDYSPRLHYGTVKRDCVDALEKAARNLEFSTDVKDMRRLVDILYVSREIFIKSYISELNSYITKLEYFLITKGWNDTKNDEIAERCIRDDEPKRY